jgi:signal peptidase I
MTKKKSPPEQPAPAPVEQIVEETPFEAAASICSVLVVGLFILTFLAQNFVIPSGSMEKTLLVGDHLVVDRVTLAPPAKWMPLVHYREPRRRDIVVFPSPASPIFTW